MGRLSEFISYFNQNFKGTLELSEDQQTIYASRNEIVKLLEQLKEREKYEILADITSVDGISAFEIIYNVQSLAEAELLRIKVPLQKNSPSIPSATSIWKAANVQEREIYDLMGIIFEGHPNLNRILCKDDFVGHPLRKDFLLQPLKRF